MKTICLYCENITNDPHFKSDCCGRGMCDDCYGTDIGTMEQIQLAYTDDEDIARIKPEYKNAIFLCYTCPIYS